MRKILMLMVAAFVLVLSPCAWADKSDEGGKAGWKGAGEKWGKELGLTADQQAKLKAIGESQRAEMKPIREQLKTLHKELKGLVDGKAGDEKIGAKLAELEKARESAQAIQRKYTEQRKAVLTPTQRAKMVLKMGGKGGKPGKKGGAGCKGGRGEKGGEDKEE